MNKTLSLFDRRVRYVIAASLLMVSTVVIPALVSAAQVTERSIALSSASVGATGVSYNLKFTAVGVANSIVLDFCSNSPVIGSACTSPTGMVVTGADSASAGVTDTVGTGHQVVITKDVAADEDVDVVITGINNPTDEGSLYARIVTFTTANAGNYTSADPTNGDANPFVDTGGVALSITPTIGVSGTVQESMTFCVSKAPPTENCGGTNPPNVELGEDVGGELALSAGALSTDSIYTQISTNAVSGAVVRMKSNAVGCGGLLRAGATGDCDIAPALTAGTGGTSIALGQAKFGLLTGTAAGAGGSANGTYQASGTYNDTNYEFNYVTGDATGVTSTYGDELLNTDGAPANNQNMELTFGASIDNSTPAGSYSTDLSMIAVGKF